MHIWIIAVIFFWMFVAVVNSQIPPEGTLLYPPPATPLGVPELACTVVPPSPVLRNEAGNLRPDVIERICRGAGANLHGAYYDGPDGTEFTCWRGYE